MLLLALLLAPAPVVSDGPAPDAHYVEVLPDRYTFAGDAAVYGWGVVPEPCCVAAVTSAAAGGTLLLMNSGRLLLASPAIGGARDRTFSSVSFTGGPGPSSGSKLATSDGVPTAFADATGLTELNCTRQLDTCAVGSATPAAFGVVTSVEGVDGAYFVAAGNGLFRCESGHCAQLLGAGGPTEAPITALAVHADGSPALIAAGSADKVWLLTPAGVVVRWEWVTAISGPHLGSGGVLDGPVTALAFDTDSTLLAGNDVALNLRHARNGSWGRICGDDGLPYANITAIATGGRDPISGAKQLWLGTAMGLVVKSADPSADPQYRYLFGPRYHPGERVTAMALSTDGAGVIAATDGGVVWLTQEPWTLARKAALMQAKLARHDRHGLVAGCSLPGYGNTSASHCTDDDNNGLWTSLVVAAEYLRYGATRDPAAAKSAAHFLGGMTMLHEITGIPGLYARSACAPTDPDCAADRHTQQQGCGGAKSCRGGSVCPGCCDSPNASACGLQWRNSTDPKYLFSCSS